MDTHLRDIHRAFVRLEKSGSRRIARRNARNEMKRLLSGIWKEVDCAYPPIRKDGSVVERREVRGSFCPDCNAPMKSVRALASHLVKVHNRHRCWCGKSAYDDVPRPT